MGSNVSGMEPLSARIPTELYLWLANLKVEGASTNSDKVRVLLGQLKKQHDGAVDYVAAHSWAQALTARLRESLVRTEGATGVHSELVAVLLEFITSSVALLMSQAPTTLEEAAKLEDMLVKRSMGMMETLLRQAATPSAQAYEPQVLERHLSNVMAVTQLLLAAKKGASSWQTL